MSRAYKMTDPEGLYFITFSTVEWIDVFTRQEYRDILINSLDFCIKEKGLRLFAYVIMSNHMHLIVAAEFGFELSSIIRDFKKYTSKKILKAIEDNTGESRKEWMISLFRKAGEGNANNKVYQFWQQDNHPIVLYSNAVIDQKLDYIHENPVKAGIVLQPEDYLYSSARNYAGLDYVIHVELLF
jgi:REP element-mobilizing transposase RayT